MSRTNRATVTVNAELRQTMISRQGAMGAAAATLDGASAGLGSDSAGLAAVGGGAYAVGGAPSSADDALASTQCRAVLVEATRAVLAADGWTVTVVDGDPGHYTGIEATRGDEHLLAAVGAGDLITDQAGAHDCAGTVDAILSGLQAAGAEVTVTNDVAHDGRGGSLYTVSGGPTRAHAIASTLRQTTSDEPARQARRRPQQLRNSIR